VRDHVPGAQRLDPYRQLATTLLLTYALRNADCHAKNLALLYTSLADVHLSPTYGMLTTNVYAGFQHKPPGIEFMGKKTWVPGKNLQKFVAATFGIQPKEQWHMVQAISDAVADVDPLARQAMAQHRGFEDIGKGMLMAWAEGVQGLRGQRVYAAGAWAAGDAFEGFFCHRRNGRPETTKSAALLCWGGGKGKVARRGGHCPPRKKPTEPCGDLACRGALTTDENVALFAACGGSSRTRSGAPAMLPDARGSFDACSVARVENKLETSP
jgi:hypothetical protein